uniref:Transposon protein, putative, Mutator sub-class n=1 Tax=Tanacetum cinerariifolium TaxID=118510 RepID=A0A6L2LA43_TANCI|nr:transposon protein, putative, Mutator sub-class [Tanacetum cinerariifolium]
MGSNTNWQSGTLVGQGSACNRGCEHKLPFAYVLRKCHICYASFGLPFLIFDVHYNGTFNFMALSKDDDFDIDIDIEQRFKGSVELEEMYKGRETLRLKNSNQSNINSSTPMAGCSRPNRVYDVGESHTVIKHKEYMDTLMHQLIDKGDCLTDPFIILENNQSNEKFPIHDEQTHWKMKKPKTFKRTSYCKMWVETREHKDISKGKQRKGNEYLSAGRDEHSKCPFRYYGEITTEEHYAMIRSYGKEILDSNDGSTIKLCVTVNPDDKTYLIVVNVENKDNWSWFLELLGEYIDMPIGNGLTLISYQNKRLIEPMKDVMPLAEHRQCARHIYEVLLLVRSKPLITMLESRRVIMMERLNTMRLQLEKWTRDICPNIQKRFWHVIPAGGNLFDVRNGSEAFTVDEHKRTCTCRRWQLASLL